LNSRTYSRVGTSGENYYYQEIVVQVNTTGIYTFKSSSSIENTFGYLYQGNFYPSFPSYNLIITNDDGGENGQFQLIATLRSDNENFRSVLQVVRR